VRGVWQRWDEIFAALCKWVIQGVDGLGISILIVFEHGDLLA
jgi:hypothetical protein